MEAANYSHFGGIDVSKEKIDVCVVVNGNRNTVEHAVFGQSKRGFGQLYAWLRQVTGDHLSGLIICVENTGLYDDALIHYLQSRQLVVSLENAYNIKRSVRDNRTKTDKLDARNIALYALVHQHELTLYEAPRTSLLLLQRYLTHRTQLVNVKKMLEHAYKEEKAFQWGLPVEAKHSNKGLAGIKKDIEEVEKRTWEVISSDEQLLKIYYLIISIPAIGKITAYHFICYTNEFKRIKSGKQLASYCGVVPFEHRSGSSVRKRTSLSSHANKILKSLLHLCAITALKMKNKLSDYYKRKREEGKMALVAINGLRNKLALTIAAVVRNGVPYDEQHQYLQKP